LLVTTQINDQEYFLFQKRSSNSGLYPGFFSIFGGAFSPQDDNEDLYTTAVRELYEEINGITNDPKEIYEQLKTLPILLTQETENGNLQINFLGIKIKTDSEFNGSEYEGSVVSIKKSEIYDFLEKNNHQITPLAMACLEYYLKLKE
jgi:8-oxo-dGTP pyrophosphatase MutT (NUDIX family)